MNVIYYLAVYTGKLSAKYRLQTAIKTDERVRLMDEIISGIQVIKMYAWEKQFCALVHLARRLELKVIKKSSYLRGLFMTFFLFTTRMSLFVTLVSMLKFGQFIDDDKYEVTADKIFMFSSYYTILANTMTTMFVRGFAEISECKVSVSRIRSFLLLDEFKNENVIHGMDEEKSALVKEMEKHMTIKTEEEDEKKDYVHNDEYVFDFNLTLTALTLN